MTVAAAIAGALSPRPVRTGRGWMVPCPAHDDRDPSLHLSDRVGGGVLFRCFSGCDQATVIDALRQRGLWGGIKAAGEPWPLPRRASPVAPDPHASDAARRLWEACRSATGTLVEGYLRSRCVTIPPPSALRFHPSLKHRPSDQRFPAMVTAVRDMTGGIVGVHRTWLRPDGRGKAPVDPAKMMLGPCAGGAVRLAEATDAVQVAEGIETALAVLQATAQATWAALSTSGMRSLAMPDHVRRVTILADGDSPGEAAAQAAAERWAREGRSVRIARPPAGFDFADLLAGCCPPAMTGDPEIEQSAGTPAKAAKAAKAPAIASGRAV